MAFTGCSLKILRGGLFKKSNLNYFGNMLVRQSRLWEPDYLIIAKQKTPEYAPVNVQIKGYDFATLGHYYYLIKWIANKMEVVVAEAWSAPTQDLIIHNYKPASTEPQYTYELKVCEKNIQIVFVPSNKLPLFIDAVITSCPPGVNVSFHKHEKTMSDIRYIPSQMVKELKEQLESIGKKK